MVWSEIWVGSEILVGNQILSWEQNSESEAKFWVGNEILGRSKMGQE